MNEDLSKILSNELREKSRHTGCAGLEFPRFPSLEMMAGVKEWTTFLVDANKHRSKCEAIFRKTMFGEESRVFILD